MFAKRPIVVKISANEVNRCTAPRHGGRVFVDADAPCLCSLSAGACHERKKRVPATRAQIDDCHGSHPGVEYPARFKQRR